MQTAKRGRLPYINKDYESIRRELFSRIPQLTDRWTDFNASDLGVVILELFSGVADMLAYYLDAQAGECYLPTARQRDNIIGLCSLVGYRLHGPVSASTRLVFTLGSAQDTDVVVPAGTVAVAPDASLPVPFVTVRNLTIPAGETTGETDAVQGERHTEHFTSTGEPVLGVRLSRTDIAEGSITVSVGGAAWREVEHFADSLAGDAHFRLDRDGLDYVTITFGDGRWGAIPVEDTDISVSYLSTLGPNGNLAPHRVTELASTIYSAGGTPVSLTVDNSTPASGGAERESADEARVLAPAALRSTWKAVTRDDYTTLCLAYPGVAKARVMDTGDDPSLRIYTVRVCIAPDGGGMPSDLLKSQVRDYLEARRLLTVDVALVDPAYVPVEVSALLYIYPAEDAGVVTKRAEDALTRMFQFDSQDFGRGVYLSDLVALLDGVAGVSHVVLRAPTRDVTPGFREIPTLGDVTLETEVVR